MTHPSRDPGHLADRPHHDGSELYVSDRGPGLEEIVELRLRVPRSWGDVVRVRVRSNPDREPRYAEAVIVASDEHVDWWEAQVLVENPVHRYRWLVERADGITWWVHSHGLTRLEARDVDDFRLVAYAPPPAWGAETILYQIFPDRFARSAAAGTRDLPDWAEPAEWTDEPIHVGPSTPTQFYGGDLAGIGEHLDHLERLGVNTIYLTPVFPARSNHRYDAWSFEHVDELLGGDEALAALTDAAHRRGFRVLGDLTSNHSGDAHEWFQAAHRTPGAPESDFYYWLDPEQESYVSWLGVPSLPKFNWSSHELRRRFIEGPGSVVAKWLAPPYSLDGWRIDVANMTGRYQADDWNETVRRIIRRTMVEVNEDTLLLGESTNDAADDFQGDAWHGAMTYANFTRPVWGWLSHAGSPAIGGIGVTLGRTEPYTGVELYEAHRAFASAFPWRTRLHTMNALDTHDTPRFLTHALPGAVPVGVGLQLTMPGIPVVFAGDEFGLTGDDGEHSRSPIPWDAVDEAAETIDLYSELIRLRRDHQVLSRGGIRWLHVDDEALVFVRESAAECVLVLAARSAATVRLPAGAVPDATARLFGPGGFADGVLTAPGISFSAWSLPGVVLPRFQPPSTAVEDQAGIGDVTPELMPEVFE